MIALEVVQTLLSIKLMHYLVSYMSKSNGSMLDLLMLKYLFNFLFEELFAKTVDFERNASKHSRQVHLQCMCVCNLS